MLQKLKKGDKIALIAPSGSINDYTVIKKAEELFDKFGLEFVIYPTVNKKYLTFAGEDKERLKDLTDAFKNKEIKAILCARGGYGTIKLLDKINYKIIKNNPKIFAGLSDITNLLLYINKKANIPTFHTSMPKRLVSEDMILDFINTVNFEKKVIKPRENSIKINPANRSGILFGGNLATFSTLIAKSDFIPNKKIILFLEDINEPVYKIDRMIQTIFRSKKLKRQLNALILGDFLGVQNEEIKYIFDELSASLKIPVYFGYKISHSEQNEAIPIGVRANINEFGVITLE